MTPISAPCQADWGAGGLQLCSLAEWKRGGAFLKELFIYKQNQRSRGSLSAIKHPRFLSKDNRCSSPPPHKVFG